MTCTDSADLSFYQENAEYVKSYGTSGMDRDERRSFNKGRRLADAMAAEAFLKARANGTRWTAEEYDALAAAYFKHGRNQRACLAEFRLYSERHTDKSVMLAVYSCAALDTKVNEIAGLKDYANGLLDSLNAIEEGRFKGNR